MALPPSMRAALHAARRPLPLLLAVALLATGCGPEAMVERPASTPDPDRPGDPMPMRRDETPSRLLDFAATHAAFRAIDDRVMGGVSQSRLAPTGAGTAVFRGDLSLEQGGGFASVRASGLALDLSAVDTLVLRARGDGKRYKLRLHDDARFDGVAWQLAFDTPAGEWAEIALPLADFVPVWRGRVVRDAPPLDRARVTAVGLLVSDGQEGPFALELDWLAGR